MILKYKTIIKRFLEISFLLLIFQSVLSKLDTHPIITNLMGSYDEFVTIMCMFILIEYWLGKGLNYRDLKYFLILFVFVLIGLIGTLKNNIQPFMAVIEDIVNCIKFFLVIFSLNIVRKRYDSLNILKTLEKLSKLLILILFVLMVFDNIFPNTLFKSNSYRYGIHSIQLFFYHPAVLAQVTVLLLSVISFRSENIKYCNIFKIMALLVIASTLRGKSFAFIFMYLFFCGYKNIRMKLGKFFLFIFACLTIFLSVTDALDKYYGNELSARSTLTADSIDIANNEFPIGLGYGTFASASAVKYYSPVYSKLGYNTKYGMGFINTNYLTDTFWPIILGEFGYLGVLFYSALLFCFLKKGGKVFKNNRNAGIGILSLIGYLLICSAASTAFFNPISVSYAMIISLGLNIYEN